MINRIVFFFLSICSLELYSASSSTSASNSKYVDPHHVAIQSQMAMISAHVERQKEVYRECLISYAHCQDSNISYPRISLTTHMELNFAAQYGDVARVKQLLSGDTIKDPRTLEEAYGCIESPYMQTTQKVLKTVSAEKIQEVKAIFESKLFELTK